MAFPGFAHPQAQVQTLLQEKLKLQAQVGQGPGQGEDGDAATSPAASLVTKEVSAFGRTERGPTLDPKPENLSDAPLLEERASVKEHKRSWHMRFKVD